MLKVDPVLFLSENAVSSSVTRGQKELIFLSRARSKIFSIAFDFHVSLQKVTAGGASSHLPRPERLRIASHGTVRWIASKR